MFIVFNKTGDARRVHAATAQEAIATAQAGGFGGHEAYRRTPDMLWGFLVETLWAMQPAIATREDADQILVALQEDGWVQGDTKDRHGRTQFHLAVNQRAIADAIAALDTAAAQ